MTRWQYVDVTSQRQHEVCSGRPSDFRGDFCNWNTVNFTLHDLGVDNTQTGNNLVLLDVNTDAYPDILYYHNNRMEVLINNHDGFDSAIPVQVTNFDDPNLPADAATKIETLPRHLPAYDFNGDGVADLMVQMGTYTQFKGEGEYTILRGLYWVAYQLQNEQGQYHLRPIIKIPTSDSSYNFSHEDKIHVSDLNGDGLGDAN